MLMKPDKKKSMASLIIGASAPSSMDSMKAGNEEQMEKPQMDEGIMSAAEEIMAAVHAKDAHALAEALQSFLEMADKDDSEQEAPEADENSQLAMPQGK